MESKRLIYKDEFGETHTTDEKINGKFVGEKIVREKLFEYEQEESEGKLIHLPCKVGDTVYYITGLSRKYVKSAIVNEIVINSKGISELFVSNDTVNFENSFDVFYLTREEAEKALEEQESNESNR